MSLYQHVNGTQEIKRNVKSLKSLSLSSNSSSIVNSVNFNSQYLNHNENQEDKNQELDSDSEDSQTEATVIDQKIDKYGFFISDSSYDIW
jgi:hypothetical protein